MNNDEVEKATNDIVELLADLAHRQWSEWMDYLFEKCSYNDDGTLTIPKRYVDRWQKQIYTDYKDLSETEKESDRIEARKVMATLGLTVTEK